MEHGNITYLRVTRGGRVEEADGVHGGQDTQHAVVDLFHRDGLLLQRTRESRLAEEHAEGHFLQVMSCRSKRRNNLKIELACGISQLSKSFLRDDELYELQAKKEKKKAKKGTKIMCGIHADAHTPPSTE